MARSGMTSRLRFGRSVRCRLDIVALLARNRAPLLQRTSWNDGSENGGVDTAFVAVAVGATDRRKSAPPGGREGAG